MSRLLLLGTTLFCGCVGTGTSDRINLCNELPTVSEKDTDQTIIEVDNFNAKYRAGYCN